MKKLFNLFIVALILLIAHGNAAAQCAMCKSNLEAARHAGTTDVGNTLNSGILYLLVLPYAIASVVGYIYYRKSKEKKALLAAQTKA